MPASLELWMPMDVVTEKIDNPIHGDVDQAAVDLAARVREQIARGWEPPGGVAIASAGTAPYLLQAIVKR